MAKMSTSSKDVSLNRVLKVRGVLQTPVLKPPTKTADELGFEPKAQAEIKLTEAEILEMSEGDIEPELKNNEWKTWMGYSRVGALKASPQMAYQSIFIKSGEALLTKQTGKKAESIDPLFGTVVTLEYTEIEKKGKKDDTPFTFTLKGYGFAAGNVDTDSLDAQKVHFQKLIVGMNREAAKRKLMQML